MLHFIITIIFQDYITTNMLQMAWLFSKESTRPCGSLILFQPTTTFSQKKICSPLATLFFHVMCTDGLHSLGLPHLTFPIGTHQAPWTIRHYFLIPFGQCLLMNYWFVEETIARTFSYKVQCWAFQFEG